MRLTLMSTLALAGILAPASAQILDEGSFEIRKAGLVVGREEFTVSRDAGGGRSLATVARFPASRPQIHVQALLELTQEGTVAALQIDSRRSEGLSRIIAAPIHEHLTVRQTSREAESSREYPRAAAAVILDDELAALYRTLADRASGPESRIEVFFPRNGKRGTVSVTRQPADSAGVTRLILTGAVTGTLRTDRTGRLLRVELGNGMVAQRPEP
jgi:hypothetical protein